MRRVITSSLRLPLATCLLALLATMTGTFSTQYLLPADVSAQTKSPDISIGVDRVGCTTFKAHPPVGKCTLALGSFKVAVDLNSLTGLPDSDADTKTGYTAIDIRLEATGNVNLVDLTGLSEVVGTECVNNAEVTAGLPTVYIGACAFEGNEMTSLGTIFEVGAECKAQGQGEIRLVHASAENPNGGSFLSNETASAVYDENDKGIDEVLTINCSLNNTVTGTNVEVGLDEGFFVSFPSVGSAGLTTATSSKSGPPGPPGLQVVPAINPLYYTLVSTASTSGNVDVCKAYDETQVTAEDQLRLLHFDGANFADITVGIDPANNFICGTTPSLSVFVLAEPAPVGGIAELPDVASAPLEAKGSSGLGAGVVAGIVAAVTAGALALGGAAWYARRRSP